MDWFNAWTIVPFLFIMFVGILIIRWIGAWMFRINDIIKLQKEILEEIKGLKSKE